MPLIAAMPLYFAYGANLDRTGMAGRCPQAVPLGPARIDGFRFIVMRDGYATIIPDPASTVHGLLWNLAPEDLLALDTFEEVETGLYRRGLLPVLHGSDRHDAVVYLAGSSIPGLPRPGYMEAVLAAAADCGLPASYRAELSGWLNAP